jgi:16S rRNA (cytosine1402-N4)-methyltransferase
MRFDSSEATPTAQQILNSWTESKLTKLFHVYGEENERSAHLAARAVVAHRNRHGPLRTTFQFSEVLKKSLGGRSMRKGKRSTLHPATKCFQAVRIYVNGELDRLSSVLDIIPRSLAVKGRACVISFHSLEDRPVKEKFKGHHGDTCFQLLTKKAIKPSEEEIAVNPRSRSARLRVIERAYALTKKKTL